MIKIIFNRWKKNNWYLWGSALMVGLGLASNVNAGYEAVINRTRSAGGIGYFLDSTNSGFTLLEIIGSVIYTLLSGLGVSFLGLIIYGGYIWFISRGNEDEVEKSKDIMIDATIGLVVVVVAYTLTYFITATIVPISINQRF